MGVRHEVLLSPANIDHGGTLRPFNVTDQITCCTTAKLNGDFKCRDALLP